MSTPFLGEVKIISWNFAPKAWAFCNGQFMPINQNQALFSLLGTMYGGNGQTTFALPDLRGRVSMHIGGGHTQGEKAGQEAHTITMSEMPPITLPSGRRQQRCREQLQHGDQRRLARPDHWQAGDGRELPDQPLHRQHRQPHHVGAAGDQQRGRQPAAREPSALSGAQLRHCAAGDIPVPELTAGRQ